MVILFLVSIHLVALVTFLLPLTIFLCRPVKCGFIFADVLSPMSKSIIHFLIYLFFFPSFFLPIIPIFSFILFYFYFVQTTSRKFFTRYDKLDSIFISTISLAFIFDLLFNCLWAHYSFQQTGCFKPHSSVFSSIYLICLSGKIRLRVRITSSY